MNVNLPDLRTQLIRLLRREGDNFRPRDWTFLFESEDGRSYECGLSSAIEYATATEAERLALSPAGYISVSIRVRMA